MSPGASARIRTVRNHSRAGNGGGRGDGDHRRTGRNDLTVSSQSCLSPAASPGARATITYPYQIVITDWPARPLISWMPAWKAARAGV